MGMVYENEDWNREDERASFVIVHSDDQGIHVTSGERCWCNPTYTRADDDAAIRNLRESIVDVSSNRSN